MHIFLLFLDSDVFSFFFLFLYFKYLYYFVAAATAAVVGSSRRRRLVGKKNQCAAERPFCIAVAHPPTHAKPARLDSVFPRVCRTVLLLLLRYYYYSNYYIGRVLSERIWESHDSIASLSLSLSCRCICGVICNVELTGFPLPHCFFLLFSSFLPISFSLSLSLFRIFSLRVHHLPLLLLTEQILLVLMIKPTLHISWPVYIYCGESVDWSFSPGRMMEHVTSLVCVMADFCFLFWLNSKLPVSASFRLGDPTNGRCFVRVRPKNYWARFSSWSYYRSRAELNSRPVDQDAPISFLRGSRSTRWGDKLPSICRTSADLSIRTDDSS